MLRQEIWATIIILQQNIKLRSIRENVFDS